MSFQRLNPSEIISKKYNWLTVIDTFFDEESKQTYAVCKCKCGNIKSVLPYQLKKGSVKSCGCYFSYYLKTRKPVSLSLEKNPNYTDGRSRHQLYGTWFQMMSRCYSKKSASYDYYGGRGIRVCEEWHDFWNFVKWSDSIGGRPNGYTLDRKNVNGNYEPSNCEWVTRKAQNRNKRDNVSVTFNGKTQTLMDWSIELGIHYRTLNNRINRGWTVERAFTEKVHTHHSKA